MASFDRTILPGGVGKITLSVATAGQQGDIRVKARVYSNDPKNKQVTLTLKAFVKGHKQVETLPGKGPEGHLPPPGAGQSLSSQVPPGAEKQQLPPPLLHQDTEKQGSPQSDQNRVPDSNMSAKMDVENYRRLIPGKHEVKFVISTPLDFEWAVQWIQEIGLDKGIERLVSPVEGRISPEELAEWVMHSPVNFRLQLQLHKLIWIGEGEER